jgi:hypothetical protein
MKRLLKKRAFAPALLASLAVAGSFSSSACSSDEGGGILLINPGERPPQQDDEGFVSDSPNGQAPRGGQNSAGGGGGGSGAPQDEGDDGADRAILEADIVQVQGDTLFALSQYAGLSVIDLSDPAHLRLRGRYEMTGMPFEMYVRDNVVYAMFSSFGHYAQDDAGGYRWVQSSHVAALDASDPARIALAGEFDLPGELSDSRIVGDVLYAVTYESNGCWQCDASPNTSVTSLAIGDLKNVRVVDRLRYASPNNSYGWGRRSVTVTPRRMYVAGVEWANGGDGPWDAGHSTIQVVDIADPGGKLVEGAKVEAFGQIDSRWQMDEHEGVLRVVSQPGVWATDMPPHLQTFRVDSSQSLVPLATKPMVLPRPESLRSVRFDGARGFAITAEQTDPLFALDFSDPADPKQLGELEIPGWVYHMEVRGDRVYALGFDNQAEGGALNVSLFDVADMTAPKLLKRVNFGGNWGQFAEDQDRVHKAFTLLPEQGLALVPFSGFTYDAPGPCSYGKYQSGIQLIDFTADDLTLRGVAPQKGAARRAFLHQGSLYAVSDDAVRSFGIADRNQPVRLGELALSQKVSRTALVGDKLVRFSNDWWTQEARLEVVPASAPDATSPLGSLDLAALEEPGQGSCYPGAFAYGSDLFTNGDFVYLTWGEGSYGYYEGGGQTPRQHVVVISLADPARPAVVGRGAFDIGDQLGGYYNYGTGPSALIQSGARVVALGSTLAFQTTTYLQGDGASLRAKLTLVDLSNPAAPRLGGSIELAQGGSFTNLVAQGTTLLASHAEPVAGQPGKVRFFVDRVDASDPDAPRKLAPVNTPGSLLVTETGRLVTVDYKRVSAPAASSQDCYEGSHDFTYYDYDNNACVRVERTFRLLSIQNDRATALAAVAFPTSGSVTGVFVGDDRVFATVGPNYYGYGYGYGYGSPGASRENLGIFTLGGFRPDAGGFRGTLTPVSSPNPWWWSMHGRAVSGQRLFVTDYAAEPHIAVFDATNLDAPSFTEKAKLRGYLNDLAIVGDSAICSLGQFGVQSVPLTP